MITHVRWLCVLGASRYFRASASAEGAIVGSVARGDSFLAHCVGAAGETQGGVVSDAHGDGATTGSPHNITCPWLRTCPESGRDGGHKAAFVTRVGPMPSGGVQVPDVRVSSFAFSAAAFALSASTTSTGGGSERYVEAIEVPSGGRLVDAIVAWAAS